ncbi:MAG: alkene reductase [Candidatus Methylacidiphilales bacterium]|nr:alkene reductase [Candidatus Methylacidiphilales bacterium]
MNTDASTSCHTDITTSSHNDSFEQPLLTPITVGHMQLSHRVVMAPLTRNRAQMPGNIPWALNAKYYGQRATPGGLLITEATPVSPSGHGYYATPGIHTEAQVEGWKQVTEAVHARGGRIFLQLWHVGRQSHSDLQVGEAQPVAPSAIIATGESYTKEGNKSHSMPRALRREEIAPIVQDFHDGAARALRAGFDGVEIHGANGYLLEQFLSDHANQRTDDYGGPLENRARFYLEVTEAVLSAAGAQRTGIRVSPSNTFGGIDHSDRWGTYSWLVGKLNTYQLAYIHLVEPRIAGNVDIEPAYDLGSARFRPLITGDTKLISAGGHTQQSGNELIASGSADLIAYGRHFIANPDLPARFARHASLNRYNRTTFYGGDETGYTDYPALASA